eukprot:4236385-Alexandrium_andersonii.AAC.1
MMITIMMTTIMMTTSMITTLMTARFFRTVTRAVAGLLTHARRCLVVGAPLSGIFTLRGAQSAIRNPPNARRYCNPPQSANCPAENATSLQAFEP